MAFAIPSFRPRTDAEMTASRRERLQREPIYLIATPPEGTSPSSSSAATPWAQRLQTLADLGVGLMQLRCKDGSTDLRRRWLRCLRDALPEQVMLIVNDDLDALWDDDGSPLADGAHLGREDACALAERSGLPHTGADGIAQGLRIARERLGEQLLLGTSTRTAEEIGRARDAGADHAGFGAMAASSTKGDTVLADRAELRLATEADAHFPVFPIGGLHSGNLHLLDLGGGVVVRRMAVGSALLDAEQPGDIARALLEWCTPAQR